MPREVSRPGEREIVNMNLRENRQSEGSNLQRQFYQSGQEQPQRMRQRYSTSREARTAWNDVQDRRNEVETRLSEDPTNRQLQSQYASLDRQYTRLVTTISNLQMREIQRSRRSGPRQEAFSSRVMVQRNEETRQEEGSRQQARDVVPLRQEAYPLRERAPIEEVIESGAWQSTEVQDSCRQLWKETPGTRGWNDQVADVLFEYEEAISRTGESNLIARLDTLSDMLKPGGALYAQRERDLNR